MKLADFSIALIFETTLLTLSMVGMKTGGFSGLDD
jgi:hypothetical protein